MSEMVLIHPNRDKVESKSTRFAVIVLCLTVAGLVAVVTAGGWSKLQGAQIVSVGYVLVFLLFAYYVAQWNRGVLPVAAALAVLLLVVAAVAAPAWFARDKSGFKDPALPPSILGLLTALVIPACLLLIAFAMRGLQQQWNVEVEVSRDDADTYYSGGGLPFEIEPHHVTS